MAMERTGANEHWLGIFEKYDVQFLVLNRHDDSDLLKLFRSQPGWTVDFEDGEAVIFVRADTAQSTDFPIYQSTIE
jgi:hypothetical protein